QHFERLPQGHERDAEILGEAPLVVETLARRNAAGANSFTQDLRDLMVPGHSALHSKAPSAAGASISGIRSPRLRLRLRLAQQSPHSPIFAPARPWRARNLSRHAEHIFPCCSLRRVF